MKFKSHLVTQVSGSVGGTTYSHNRGGLYMRARSIPVNTNTAAQLAAKNAVDLAATEWREVLTDAQRDAWTGYAATTPVTDVFGDPLQLSGQQMYIRCRTPRIRSGLSEIFNAPATAGLPDLVTPGADINDTTGAISVTFNDAQDWVNQNGSSLIVQTSRYYPASINYFRGPFRFLGTIDGNPTTPPTSPELVATTNAFGESGTGRGGQRIWLRFRLSLNDNRLSAPQIVQITVTS